jgi:DNA polymerase-3 subunit alpha
VLIAPGRLTDFCPLYCAEGGNAGDEKKSVSQFDKDDVEAVGLVKFDFLGLRTLTIIDWAVRYVRVLHEKAGVSPEYTPFAIETIPLDDKRTYDLLRRANTSAVFQLESQGMKKLIDKLKPDTFEDIVALVALYRPGPLESGMVEDFIARKHGKATAEYFHPDLETSLKPTYGVIVYQEQVMQISQIIGGYTLGGADMLRRAMGKKNPEEMAKHRDIFVGGAIKRGIDDKLATRLFDLMEMFAGYGFNKSHSAAYALVSYQTAFLKAHYPAAFMASTMSSDMDNTDKVHNFYVDTLEQNVAVLAPDINRSEYRFAPVDEKTIAYGLGAVKGTGENAIGNIVAARKVGPFLNLFDFCHRVDNRIVNRRAVEALIRAGAFDSINDHRSQLLATLDTALGSAEQKTRSANQNSLFGDDEGANMPVQMANVARWSLREQLQNEKISLGFYFSGHPYQEFEDELAHFVKLRLSEITPPSAPQNGAGRRAGKEVLLAGMVGEIRIQQTRRGRMAIIKLEDGTGQLEVTAFNELYEASRTWIREGELLVVKGKASFDEYSGSMRVTAEEVFDLASARAASAKRLEIICSTNTPVRIQQLSEKLKPWCGGKCPVVLHYSNLIASAPMRLGEAWQVSLPDLLINDLRTLLGEDNVRIVYASD